MRFIFKSPTLNERCAIAWHQTHWMSTLMKDWIKDNGLWEDLSQTIYTAAYEAHRSRLSKRDTSNLAQRQIHAFLRQFGIRREKHSQNYTLSEFRLREEEGDY